MDLEYILKEITEANENEITEIAHALIQRQKILHPDWKPIYISFPIKSPEACERILRYVWKILIKVNEAGNGERSTER